MPSSPSYTLTDYPFQQNGFPIRGLFVYCSNAALTPTGTGLQTITIKPIPYNPLVSGLVSVQWNIVQIFFRVEVAASVGNTTMQIVRSLAGNAAFTTSNAINDTPMTIPASTYQLYFQGAQIDNPVVNSDDKIAVTYSSLGSGATNFTVYCVLQAAF